MSTDDKLIQSDHESINLLLFTSWLTPKYHIIIITYIDVYYKMYYSHYYYILLSIHTMFIPYAL